MILTKDVEKRVEELNSDVKALIEEIKASNSSMIAALGKLNDRIDMIELHNGQLFTEFVSDVSKIVTLIEQFNSELNEFKLAKNNIISVISEDVGRQLNDTTTKLKTDLDAYNKAKESFSKLVREADSISENLVKFNKVMNNVNEVDFSLSKYVDKVNMQDAEKLRLMKQIDALERVISVERRRNSPNGQRTPLY